MSLASCGGGDGSNSSVQQPPVVPVQPARADIFFGYYGTSPGQVAATFDHVNLCWVDPWGGKDAQIGFMQECQARKLPVVLDISDRLFNQRHFIGSITSTAWLRQYFAELKTLGLLDSIIALYPQDEPDMNLDDPSEVVPAAEVIRSVAAEFGKSFPLWAIYSHNNPLPASASTFDALGVDWYTHGPQDVARKPGQKLLVIAGGADPFREAPEAYESFALKDADVAAVLAFVYFDYELGAGIGHNGMLPQYRAAGCRITRKCPSP